MGVSVLEGLEAYAVREHELSQIDYVPETRNITGFSYNHMSVRNELFYGSQKEKILEYRRKEIDEDYFKKIMEKAAKIFENETTSEQVRIFLDSITHMRNSEFSQAFLNGWIIIEQHVLQKWKNKIQQISSNITNEKATNRVPKVAVMIEELKDNLTSQDYTILRNLKKIRNDHLHNGKQITKNEAETCINLVKEVINYSPISE